MAGDSPAAVRLKIVLKALLRAWGFRCLRAAELPAAGDGRGGGENSTPKKGPVPAAAPDRRGPAS